MTYIFKSQATGDLTMLNETVTHILEIIGKEPSPRGIITVAQMEGAIRKLKEAVIAEKAQEERQHLKSEVHDYEEDDEHGKEHDKVMHVSFEHRVWPFIEMLKTCQQANKDVVWGV